MDRSSARPVHSLPFKALHDPHIKPPALLTPTAARPPPIPHPAAVPFISLHCPWLAALHWHLHCPRHRLHPESDHPGWLTLPTAQRTALLQPAALSGFLQGSTKVEDAIKSAVVDRATGEGMGCRNAAHATQHIPGILKSYKTTRE